LYITMFNNTQALRGIAALAVELHATAAAEISQLLKEILKQSTRVSLVPLSVTTLASVY